MSLQCDSRVDLHRSDKVRAKQELKAALTNNPSKEEGASIRELIGKI